MGFRNSEWRFFQWLYFVVFIYQANYRPYTRSCYWTCSKSNPKPFFDSLIRGHSSRVFAKETDNLTLVCLNRWNCFLTEQCTCALHIIVAYIPKPKCPMRLYRYGKTTLCAIVTVTWMLVPKPSLTPNQRSSHLS